jgi:hypothetical protein
MRTMSLVKATFGYGVVCFGVLLGWFLGVPRLCSPIFREDRWTVWKEILHMLACVLAVCAGNILFTHFYFHEAFSSQLVTRFLWWTFIVSILPITLMVLFRQISLMKTFGREAAELDKQLRESRSMVPAGPPTPVSPSSPHPGKFLYAEAADNYVKVFYTHEQQLIRSTLRQLEETFQGNERIFRCHRTYLVNLDKVVHISGNAQGYKLHLEGVGQVIPVSRSLNGQIANLVTRPKDPPNRPSDL